MNITMKLIASATLAASAILGHGSPIYWSASAVELPDGSTAGAGDVTMYVFETWGIHGYGSEIDRKKDSFDYYALIHSEQSIDWAKDYDVFALSGVTDADGNVSLTDGSDPGASFNAWAMVLFVCEYDGNEYYWQRFADHYATGKPPSLTNSNLDEGIDWRQGVALESTPEPSSALLLLFGCAALALRRRSDA